MGESQHVALYTRVSTAGQAEDGYSLTLQRDRLEAYVHSKPAWRVASIYEDDGYSARTTDRPAYQRLWDEIDTWDMLLVVCIDRAHRNTRNFLQMMDHLRERDRHFASAEESLDTTTPIGRFVVDIIARIAQLESEQIGKRTSEGKAAIARDGYWPHGSTPTGYQREDANGHYTLTPDEDAALVREAFHRYASGDLQQEIADDLPWSVMTVSNILNNPVYHGIVRSGDVQAEGRHPSLVSDVVWEAVQDRLARRRRRGTD